MSISEYEPWQAPGGTGTPILMKFSTLTSEDREREMFYEKKKAMRAKRDARQREKSRSVEAQLALKDKSLESTDSYTLTRNSLDYKSSSLEKDSSLEPNSMSRDTSFDTFKNSGVLQRKWANANVLVETDISKIGIDTENILEMGRRNTCPNPPIYR